MGVVFAALLVALSPAGGAYGQEAPSGTDACKGVARIELPDAKIVSAETVPAGAFTPPANLTPWMVGDPSFYKTLAAFCRVVVRATPSADSNIQIEVWMPLERLEREVPGPGQRRVRRGDRLSLDGGCRGPGVRDGGHEHGSLRRSDGRELGARSSGERDRLRVPRDPLDDPDRQRGDQGVLRQESGAFVLRELLERGAAGVDGGAALSRGLRRHPRGGAGQLLDAPADEGGRGRAGDDPRSGELHPGQQAPGDREGGERRVRCPGRRDRRSGERPEAMSASIRRHSSARNAIRTRA